MFCFFLFANIAKLSILFSFVSQGGAWQQMLYLVMAAVICFFTFPVFLV